MTVNLTPEQQKPYNNADDVIAQALELLQCNEIC